MVCAILTTILKKKWLRVMAEKVYATIVIPTYNGDRHLASVLEAALAQDVDFSYEVLIIDSGSTDKTLDIIKSFQNHHPNIIFQQIPNTEYGHGKTRDLAAHDANGEIIVYISHDAIPAHNQWLYEMVKPFGLNEKVAGVMGKQIPRPNCIPMLKSEIRGVFSNFGPDFGTTIFYKDSFVKDQGVYDAISFYSDSNSAARKEYLTGILPYKHVAYAEDQILGRDIIDAGYYKVYAPRASVVHSNDLKLGEYKHRMFDETLGLRKIGLPMNIPSSKLIGKMIVRGVLRDARNILRDKEYSARRKIYWLAVNPFFHIEKWRGVRRACLVDISDVASHDKYSLESNKKQG